LLGSFVITLPQLGLAFGNAGHESVVAVALQIDPTLRPRLEAILKDLPDSQKWQDLQSAGLTPNNRFQTEKQDPDGWVKALAHDADKAATFPDWARDYKDYTHQKYDKWHFFDLDYDDAEDQRFVEQPNALTILAPFQDQLQNGSAGERAWALVWILH